MERELPGTETIAVTGPDGFRDACKQLLDLAPGHTVRILAPHLDPVLFNHEALIESLRQRIRRTRHTQIQVLFEDAGPAVQQGHRLITLARRWPNSVALRQMAAEVRDDSAWILVEPHDLLWRPDHLHYSDGILAWKDKRKAPQLRRQFDEWWQRAQPDPGLRQLHI